MQNYIHINKTNIECFKLKRHKFKIHTHNILKVCNICKFKIKNFIF